MKFFITGASGFIGTEVTKELLAHGYEVAGLARSDASAKKLTDLGAEAIKGSLQDFDVLTKAAKESDGVIHLGFIHDFTNFAASLDIDRQVVKTLCDALVGSDKPYVHTFGTLSLIDPEGATVDETFEPVIDGSVFSKRTANEQLALSYASKGVKVSSIRLSPTVHGEGDHGFIPTIFQMFKGQGTAYYPDEGTNTWPAVNKHDAAGLYRLAAEKASAGTILHGVAETGVSTKSIAEALAKKGGLKLESVPHDKLSEKLGPFFGMVFGAHNPVSSEKTKEITGWNPSCPGLLEDINSYY